MAVDPPHRIPGATDTTTYTLDPAPLQGRDELVEEVAESLRRVNHSPPWGVSIWTAFARAALAVAARRQGGERELLEFQKARADMFEAEAARLRSEVERLREALEDIYMYADRGEGEVVEKIEKLALAAMNPALAAPHGEEGKR